MLPLFNEKLSMTPEAWSAIGIYVATQIITLVGVVIALKGDTKTLKQEMAEMKQQLKSLVDVVVAQALQGERIRQMEQRELLTGKRIDEVQTRVNRYLDKIAFTKMTQAEQGE